MKKWTTPFIIGAIILVALFDLYQGQGVAENKKSLALSEIGRAHV